VSEAQPTLFPAAAAPKAALPDLGTAFTASLLAAAKIERALTYDGAWSKESVEELGRLLVLAKRSSEALEKILAASMGAQGKPQRTGGVLAAAAQVLEAARKLTSEGKP
jgi:hypothetical protein